MYVGSYKVLYGNTCDQLELSKLSHNVDITNIASWIPF